MSAGTSARRIVVPYRAASSATPREILAAAQGLADVSFVVARDDAGTVALLPLLTALADVVEVSTVAPDVATTELSQLASRPAGTVAFVDQMLPLSAAIAESFGLAGSPLTAVNVCTSKLRQRRVLNAAGCGEVKTRPLRPRAAIADDLAFPVIVKPDRGSASRHAFIALSPEELRAGVKELPDGAYVAEELLIGCGHPTAGWLADYCSVESAVVAREVHHLGICDRMPLAPPVRESGLVFPSALDDASARAVRDLASRAIAAVGLTSGLVHTEIKLTAAGPRVIEVNARLGGHVQNVMTRSGTCNPVRIALQVSLGADANVTPREPDRVLMHYEANPPVWAREVNTVADLVKVRQFEGVVAASRYKRPGDAVDWREGTGGNLGVLIEAADHDELHRRWAAVADYIEETTQWS
jgi:hypothetical protein